MLEDKRRLTQENIEHIKYIKRFGNIMGILLFCFGFILGIVFALEEKESYNWLIIYNLSVIAISFLIALFVNREYNNDLLYNEKTIKKDILKNKKTETFYLAGSFVLPAINQKMQENDKLYYYFEIGNREYSVGKEIYNQLETGEEVELHYALCSKMLLEITKK